MLQLRAEPPVRPEHDRPRRLRRSFYFAALSLVLVLLIGGYTGAMVIGWLIWMRPPSVRHLGLRLMVLACYAVAAGAIGVLLLGPMLDPVGLLVVGSKQ